VTMWKELQSVLTRNQSTVYSIERTMRVVRVETDLTKRQEEMQPAGVALLPDPNVRETSAEETLNGMSSGDMFEIVGIRYPEKLLPQVVEAAKKNWEKINEHQEVKGHVSLKRDDPTPIDPISYKKATTQQRTMKSFFKSVGNKKSTNFVNWDDFEEETNTVVKTKKKTPQETNRTPKNAENASNAQKISAPSSARIKDFFKNLHAEMADMENLERKRKLSEEAADPKRSRTSPNPIPLKENMEENSDKNDPSPVEYVEID